MGEDRCHDHNHGHKQTTSDTVGQSSAEVLRNMALTDALQAQRTVAALREAALSEIIKKLPGMKPNEMMEVIKAIDTTSSLGTYATLIEKIDSKK